MTHPMESGDMTPEQLADRAEQAAIERYLMMRGPWRPCWGVIASARKPRPTP